MRIFLSLIVLIIFIFSSCTERLNDPPDSTVYDISSQVAPVGALQSFEMATWNIEHFPKAGSNTIKDVKAIIKQLDVDLIAVEEISDSSALNGMLSDIPEWKAVLSNDRYGDGSYQKTGILYKSSFISVSNPHNIFEDDSYAFPRPPLTAFVEVRDTVGVKFDFNIIVLHLKAFSGESNEDRRRAAVEKLHDYITTEISAGSDRDFIVLGDWNDQISDTGSVNVFQSILKDSSNFTFLTASIPGQYSYISNSFKSLIDHILITADARNEFNGGVTEVLYLDDVLSFYPNEVSDHRPVVSIFGGFSLALP